MSNPLVESHTLPPFSKIQAEHVVPAMETLLMKAKSALASQLATIETPDWESLCVPMEASEDRIAQAWNPVSHLHGVLNSDELREKYEEAQQLLTEYYTELGQNKPLFESYKKLAESESFKTLDQPKKQTVTNAIRDFRLSGVDLEAEKAKRYKEIRSRLSTLTTSFSNNVLDATQGWYKCIESEEELAGLPDFIVQAAKAAADEKGEPGYVLTLDLPVYITVQTQSDNRELRQAMYEAYTTRASQEGPTAGKWDNTEIIEEILALRQEQAEILGFNNYAELSIEPKMAEKTAQVVDFLQELAAKSKPFAEKEMADLALFAEQEYGVTDIQPWDMAYYSEKLKIKRHSISQEELREYFPLETVLSGLFKVVNQLFDIEVEAVENTELWHEDARYLEIKKNGCKIAAFYLDLYARGNKRGGAWMAQCRDRRKTDEGIQLPVAFLVCNFNPPSGDKPALLTHDDVTTLFHEFGHGIHHMLTQIDVAAVSGIAGVAWDAVELPSQFLENFCWEPEVLKFLSSHYESGEPLPQEKLDNMLAAKNFHSAMQMVRQIEFALFDFRLHMEFGTEGFNGVQALLNEVRQDVAVVIPPEYNKFQNGFSHIFAGGYAAGYYSYKWAEVLSADAFSAFEEEGVFNKDTGLRYLHEILEKGGSEDAAVLFRNFRGRDPEIEPLLRHSGLA